MSAAIALGICGAAAVVGYLAGAWMTRDDVARGLRKRWWLP